MDRAPCVGVSRDHSRCAVQLRAHPVEGLTALISSQVNQLTLLVGSMTVIFSMSAGEVISFPLNDRQGIEFLLTTAVSLFGVLLIAKRVISWKMGAVLLVLFIAHLLFPNEDARRIFAFIYLGPGRRPGSDGLAQGQVPLPRGATGDGRVSLTGTPLNV